jgi:hypothetical protein
MLWFFIARVVGCRALESGVMGWVIAAVQLERLGRFAQAAVVVGGSRGTSGGLTC